jgi:hypothetical protein
MPNPSPPASLPRSPFQPPPAPDGEIAEASLPGWSPPPPPPPGLRNPDQPQDQGQEPASDSGDGSGSGQTPRLTPASFKKKSSAYATVAEALLVALGGLANKTLTPEEDESTFIPDEDDRRDIAKPLGSLAARRIPLGDAEGSLSDLADLGQLAVGVAVYAAKSLTGWLGSRAERRRRKKAQSVMAEGLQEAG